MTTPFSRNIASRAMSGGDYALAFDDTFRGVAGQFGGLALAASLQVAADELDDPSLLVRSASCVFVAPVPVGEVSARVAILRRGRSVAHISVALRSDDDRPLLHTIAVLGRTRPGFAFTARRRPDVPAPDACPSFLAPPPHGETPPPPPWTTTPFWQSVDRRIAAGHHWWERGWQGGNSTGALWLRLREPPPDEAARRLVAMAFTDMAGQSIAEYIGPEAPPWGMVSTDHTAHALACPRSDWLLVSFRANRAADGFVSVATEVWDETGELVALGTQVVLLLMD